MGYLYLIHFEPSVEHARHYLGWAADVGPRFNAHKHGVGARLTQVAVERGCQLILARVWKDKTRLDERRLKRQKNGPKLCPICQARVGVQLPLLDGISAYIPQPDPDPIEALKEREITA